MSDLSIQGIWKPGSKPPTTPKNILSSKKNKKSNSKKENSQTKKSPRSSGNKRLSGSTMNMRFMKRKTDSSSAKKISDNSKNNSVSADPSNDSARNEMRQWLEKSPSQSRMSDDVHMSSAEVCNEHSSVTPVDRVDSSGPERATDADIYGVGAQIIGRRSFGGFNKVVQETWNTAYKEIEKKNKKKNKKSEDQLMREYKQELYKGEKRKR